MRAFLRYNRPLPAQPLLSSTPFSRPQPLSSLCLYCVHCSHHTAVTCGSFLPLCLCSSRLPTAPLSFFVWLPAGSPSSQPGPCGYSPAAPPARGSGLRFLLLVSSLQTSDERYGLGRKGRRCGRCGCGSVGDKAARQRCRPYPTPHHEVRKKWWKEEKGRDGEEETVAQCRQALERKTEEVRDMERDGEL